MKAGEAAEQEALRFLTARGLALVERNWRCRAGELDLVLEEGDTLVVAEVRSRSRPEFGTAAESVDARKQARIARATRLFLASRPHLADRPLRFDIVAFDRPGGIEWMRGAFEPED